MGKIPGKKINAFPLSVTPFYSVLDKTVSKFTFWHFNGGPHSAVKSVQSYNQSGDVSFAEDISLQGYKFYQAVSLLLGKLQSAKLYASAARI